MAVLLGAVSLVSWEGGWIGESPIWPKTGGFVAVNLLVLYLADLYNLEVRLGRGELILRLGLASVVAAVVFAAVGYAVPGLRFGRKAFFTMVGISTVELMVSRLILRNLGSSQRLQKRVLVLGSKMADMIISQEGEHSAFPFRILGFLDDDPQAYEYIPPGYDLLGKPKDLPGVVEDLRPDLLLVALADRRGTFPVKELLECRFRGVRVEEWPTFYEKLTGRIFVNGLRPSWFIFSDGFVKTRLTETLKRAFDVVLSLIGVLLSAPLMGLVALLIKLDSPGPVLYRQERVGKDGKIFILNKFRSMRRDAEAMTGPVWAGVDDPRVTRVGHLLRKTRLDEFPQIINVLKGEMSFVGPRPERPHFVAQLQERIPFYSQRHTVKPGITGWAQVKYSYGATIEDALEKLQYDLYYIKNMSILLDFIILMHTVQVVLFGKGSR